MPAATPLAAELTDTPSHLQQVHADLASRFIIEGHTDGEPPSTLRTSVDYGNYISARTQAWDAAAGNQRPPAEVG